MGIAQTLVRTLQDRPRSQSRKTLRRHVSELPCKVFCSRDPALARFLIRTVIRYCDCYCHKLIWTAKLGADRNETLASAGRFPLSDFRMCNLHERSPPLATTRYRFGSGRALAAPVAERAALRAILADSEDPWAHYALGCVYLFKRRFDESLAELALALRLNPNFSLAQGYYGLTLSYCGRWEEASVAAHRALRLNPRDPFSAIYYGVASYAQFVGRNYEEAMRLAAAAVRLRADFVGGHRVLTAVAGMAGQADVAAAALQELRRAQPNISLAWIANQMP
jgi:tetratricopeptide (TPR) repeat protein